MEFAACLTLSMTNLLRSFAESLLHISRSKQSAIEKYNASRRFTKMPSRTSSYKRRYNRTTIFSGLPIRKLGQAGTPFACTFCLLQNVGERHTIDSYNLHHNRSPPICKTSLSAPPPPTHKKKKKKLNHAAQTSLSGARRCPHRHECPSSVVRPAFNLILWISPINTPIVRLWLDCSHFSFYSLPCRR